MSGYRKLRVDSQTGNTPEEAATASGLDLVARLC